ncbi:hypothetical protein [Spirosoma flavum]|uniref:Uncharacterized protein n=1 Tax=Spirosoma flavum TaxID=2048557 RepID=A0ABW6ABR1_9BACT
MRTTLIKTATGCLAIVSLIACPFILSDTIAMSSRDAFSTTSTFVKDPTSHAQARPVTFEKNHILARNSSAKVESVSTATAPKVNKEAEKKTISRCWKRLMNMAREIRHAHTKTTK